MMFLREEVYDAYKDRVARYLYAKAATPEDAEDLLSIVFLKIYEGFDHYDPKKASLSTWIYTIAHNTVCNYYRERAAKGGPVCLEEAECLSQDLPLEEILNREMQKQLAKALASLPQKQRDLLVLHYYEGLSLKKAALMMHISYANAKYIHFTALHKLKTLLPAE